MCLFDMNMLATKVGGGKKVGIVMSILGTRRRIGLPHNLSLGGGRVNKWIPFIIFQVEDNGRSLL